MNAIVIQHVKVGDLPEEWRTRLAANEDVRVTVRIEEESSVARAANVDERTDDPLFGMWRDREDIADVAGYVRKIRASRISRGA
jgi:hypothetical protein